MDRSISIEGVRVPTFLYGTAWKEERTAALVHMALECGFRGIDTANQRRHYHEAGVGEALRETFARGHPSRDELFIQTKFTYAGGQDHRLPYDPDADWATQVRQSLASSLEHLEVERVDSFVLHGPMHGRGLAEADLEVWRAMAALRREGKTSLLGISNVSAEQLEALCERASPGPAFVQNRCYADTGWDRAVRGICRKHGIVYQGFSLLTANQRELRSKTLVDIAARTGRDVPGVVFRFALELGMIPLTGTADPAHARSDLSAYEFELSPEDVARIEAIAL